MSKPLRPILVMMSYRGGERLARCLDSIAESEHHFNRIILSVTATAESDDMRRIHEFQQHRLPRAELLCTGRELPTMLHQAYWVSYLEDSGSQDDEWIYWLAYDDEVRLNGIEAIVDSVGNWPLQAGTAYFGPWAMRHESSEHPYAGSRTEPLESWTSFPEQGPSRLPVTEWIADQLLQPTYMQMSGSVCMFRSFLALRDRHPRKRGPMRIEMAAAAAPPNEFVEEFDEPISIIYGRATSDRANYGSAARIQDVHLAAWMLRRVASEPFFGIPLAKMVHRVTCGYFGFLRRGQLPSEEWRVRGTVQP